MSVTGVGGRYSLLVQSLSTARVQLEDLQRQLGTGQRSTTYAGLGVERGLSIGLRNQLNLMRGYADAVTNVGVRVDLAQSVLGDIGKISNTVKNSANTATFTIDNTGQTITQRAAASQLDQVFVLLNTQAGDRYLFSGRATNQPSVEPLSRVLDGDVSHAGFRQIVSERRQADLGANGLGRLFFPPAVASPATLAGTGATLTADAAASLAGTNDLSGAYTSAAGGTLSINGTAVAIGAGDDLTAILAAINNPATVAATGVSASAPGGLLTLTAGDDDAVIDLAGTSPGLLAEFGIAAGPAAPNNLITQGAVTAGQTLTVTVGANPPLAIIFGTDENAVPPEVSTLAELNAALGTLVGGTAAVDPTGNITVVGASTSDAVAIGGSANPAAFGLGTTGASPSNPVSLSEEAPATVFGFKLASLSTTAAGIAVSGPAGTPATVAVDFQAQPIEGNQVTLSFTLPDGSTEQIALTATTATPPGPGKFAIGGTLAATTASFQAVLNAEVAKLADTALTAASAIAASNDFFDVANGQPPMRVAGPPFASATALVAGTPADTVIWYGGEMGTDPARGTAVAQVDNSLTVSYGARANEQAIAGTIKNIAVYAMMVYSTADANAQDRFFAVNQRVGASLAGVNGEQRLSDIQAELAFAQSTMTSTQQSQAQRNLTLTNLLQEIEQVSPDEVASQVLALQTQLQASLQTTAMLLNLSIINYI